MANLARNTLLAVAASMTFDSESLTFANDTHVDQNGRYARQTVTFGDSSQAYLDVYDTAITGTTTARAAQLDIRLTNVSGPTACRSSPPWRC